MRKRKLLIVLSFPSLVDLAAPVAYDEQEWVIKARNGNIAIDPIEFAFWNDNNYTLGGFEASAWQAKTLLSYNRDIVGAIHSLVNTPPSSIPIRSLFEHALKCVVEPSVNCTDHPNLKNNEAEYVNADKLVDVQSIIKGLFPPPSDIIQYTEHEIDAILDKTTDRKTGIELLWRKSELQAIVDPIGAFDTLIDSFELLHNLTPGNENYLLLKDTLQIPNTVMFKLVTLEVDEERVKKAGKYVNYLMPRLSKDAIKLTFARAKSKVRDAIVQQTTGESSDASVSPAVLKPYELYKIFKEQGDMIEAANLLVAAYKSHESSMDSRIDFHFLISDLVRCDISSGIAAEIWKSPTYIQELTPHWETLSDDKIKVELKLIIPKVLEQMAEPILFKFPRLKEVTLAVCRERLQTLNANIAHSEYLYTLFTYLQPSNINYATMQDLKNDKLHEYFENILQSKQVGEAEFAKLEQHVQRCTSTSMITEKAFYSYAMNESKIPNKEHRILLEQLMVPPPSGTITDSDYEELLLNLKSSKLKEIFKNWEANTARSKFGDFIAKFSTQLTVLGKTRPGAVPILEKYLVEALVFLLQGIAVIDPKTLGEKRKQNIDLGSYALRVYEECLNTSGEIKSVGCLVALPTDINIITDQHWERAITMLKKVPYQQLPFFQYLFNLSVGKQSNIAKMLSYIDPVHYVAIAEYYSAERQRGNQLDTAQTIYQTFTSTARLSQDCTLGYQASLRMFGEIETSVTEQVELAKDRLSKCTREYKEIFEKTAASVIKHNPPKTSNEMPQIQNYWLGILKELLAKNLSGSGFTIPNALQLALMLLERNKAVSVLDGYKILFESITSKSDFATVLPFILFMQPSEILEIIKGIKDWPEFIDCLNLQSQDDDFFRTVYYAALFELLSNQVAADCSQDSDSWKRISALICIDQKRLMTPVHLQPIYKQATEFFIKCQDPTIRKVIHKMVIERQCPGSAISMKNLVMMAVAETSIDSVEKVTFAAASLRNGHEKGAYPYYSSNNILIMLHDARFSHGLGADWELRQAIDQIPELKILLKSRYARGEKISSSPTISPLFTSNVSLPPIQDVRDGKRNAHFNAILRDVLPADEETLPISPYATEEPMFRVELSRGKPGWHIAEDPSGDIFTYKPCHMMTTKDLRDDLQKVSKIGIKDKLEFPCLIQMPKSTLEQFFHEDDHIQLIRAPLLEASLLRRIGIDAMEKLTDDQLEGLFETLPYKDTEEHPYDLLFETPPSGLPIVITKLIQANRLSIIKAEAFIRNPEHWIDSIRNPSSFSGTELCKTLANIKQENFEETLGSTESRAALMGVDSPNILYLGNSVTYLEHPCRAITPNMLDDLPILKNTDAECKLHIFYAEIDRKYSDTHLKTLTPTEQATMRKKMLKEIMEYRLWMAESAGKAPSYFKLSDFESVFSFEVTNEIIRHIIGAGRKPIGAIRMPPQAAKMPMPPPSKSQSQSQSKSKSKSRVKPNAPTGVPNYSFKLAPTPPTKPHPIIVASAGVSSDQEEHKSKYNGITITLAAAGIIASVVVVSLAIYIIFNSRLS